MTTATDGVEAGIRAALEQIDRQFADLESGIAGVDKGLADAKTRIAELTEELHETGARLARLRARRHELVAQKRRLETALAALTGTPGSRWAAPTGDWSTLNISGAVHRALEAAYPRPLGAKEIVDQLSAVGVSLTSDQVRPALAYLRGRHVARQVRWGQWVLADLS